MKRVRIAGSQLESSFQRGPGLVESAALLEHSPEQLVDDRVIGLNGERAAQHTLRLLELAETCENGTQLSHRHHVGRRHLERLLEMTPARLQVVFQEGDEAESIVGIGEPGIPLSRLRERLSRGFAPPDPRVPVTIAAEIAIDTKMIERRPMRVLTP